MGKSAEEVGLRAMRQLAEYFGITDHPDVFVDKQAASIVAAAIRDDRAEPVSDWQAIESAPKDGSHVLLFRRIHGFNVIGHGYWAEDSAHGIFISGWIAFGITEPPGNLGLAEPSHWMPLPAPPRTADEKGGAR